MLARFLTPALAMLVAVPFALAPVPASAQEPAAIQNTALDNDVTFSTEELDQILAPIALYPDNLLSNVLIAATYPLEVVQAARWIEEPANAKLKDEALTEALEEQDWDPSVKSLTQFPDVLAMMSEQLDWTERLGDAVLANQAEVMDRVQFLRDKADEAGNLKSNQHQTVTTRTTGGTEYIYIEPAEPDVIYVPVYEPAVYGNWWYPDYPPYYWDAGGAYVDDYYWGSGVSVYLPLWGWAQPRWRDHFIHVDVHRYNRFSRHRKIKSSRWRANAHHRRHRSRGEKFRHGRAQRANIRRSLRGDGDKAHRGNGVRKERRRDGDRAGGRGHKRDGGSAGPKKRRSSAIQQRRGGKNADGRGGSRKVKVHRGGGKKKVHRGGGPRKKVHRGGGKKKVHRGGGPRKKVHRGGGKKKVHRGGGPRKKVHRGGGKRKVHRGGRHRKNAHRGGGKRKVQRGGRSRKANRGGRRGGGGKGRGGGRRNR
jgi:Protein of unknown function (DUF3300)